MTYGEAYDYMFLALLQHDNTDIDKLNQAKDLVDKACYSADRYVWHDLRKNPDDLPTVEHEVEVVCKRKVYNSEKTKLIYTHGFYEDGKMLENDSSLGWEDIEGEYDEEEDCYIIPEGWWEYRHYNPDDVYNNTIDDEVIAWREIELFEEVEE